MKGVITRIEQMSEEASVCTVYFREGDLLINAKDLVFVKRRKFFENTLKPSKDGGEFMYNGPDLRVGDLVRPKYPLGPLDPLGNIFTEGVLHSIERTSRGASFKYPKCWIDVGNLVRKLILINANELEVVKRFPEIYAWADDSHEDDGML